VSDWLISYGSWCLAPFGLLGMWAAGRKKAWGWALSLCTQVLWGFYAVGTGQYGFLIGTCSYALVYARNWHIWRRDARGSNEGAEEDDRPSEQEVRAAECVINDQKATLDEVAAADTVLRRAEQEGVWPDNRPGVKHSDEGAK
jgi:hypothetical protein